MVGMTSDTRSRKWLIWGAAGVTAVWLGLSSAAAVTKTLRPSAALSLPVSNGFAYEARAAQASIAGDTPLQRVRVTAAQRDDAQAALRREPLASTALTIAGLDRAQQGDGDTATRLMVRANELDKRQLVANAWLINHYGTAGRDRKVLTLLDEALKVRPELSGRYMPAFAQALGNAETVNILYTLLHSRPAWRGNFWQAVSANPAALSNAQVLRSRLLKAGEPLGPTDALLMQAFINAKRLDLAMSYARNLPDMHDDSGNLLRNGSFDTLPVLPPLDWQLKSDGRVGAAIDEGRGTLEINAIAGASAVAARQLVALQPGNYILFAKLGQASLTRGSEVVLHMMCADERAANPLRLDVPVTGDVERPFAVPADSNCRYYWVDVEFSALNATGPSLASIAEIRITPGRLKDQTPPAAF
ncbi:hypothetical protein DMC47_26505 [Nostoc sp. 3335mG]|nr:hypothetical protein DMC47_26505 [Nostoc sp. 3335mG]